MAISIYFSETRDFKLIRDLIDVATDEYLVYLYADTNNIKLPRELVKYLPLYGNNLIWVDSAEMDNSQMINHVMLTIGQLITAEDPLHFVIASRTSKFDKAIQLLQSQGISIEKTGADLIQEKKSKRKPGRPKGSSTKSGKKRGRPAKAKATEGETVEKKRRGRPPKAQSAEAADAAKAAVKTKKKRGRPAKKQEAKPNKTRKPRVDKPITQADIDAALAQFPTKDGDVELIQKKLFALKKVQRPKFDQKLSEMIQTELAIGESEANSLITKMKETGMMDNSGVGKRLKYKD